MKLSAYYALQHSYKGSEWKSHKYLYKKDGRYEVDPDKLAQGEAIEVTKEEAYDMMENDPNADNEITDVNQTKRTQARAAYEDKTTSDIKDLERSFNSIGIDDGKSKNDKIHELTKSRRVAEGREDHPFLRKKTIKHDYLEHHGVKGQKWGVQNGPPYPLDPDDKSVAEKNANDEVLTGTATVSFHDSNWYEVEERGYPNGDTGYFSPAEVIKEFLKEGTNPYPSRFRNGWEQHPVIDDELKDVNPDHGKPGTENNCCMCAAAVEAKQRGFDVRAGRCEDGCLFETSVKEWFCGAKLNKCDTGSFEETVVKMHYSNGHLSNGSGIFDIDNCFGGKHALHYTVYNDKLVIEDGQTGKYYEGMDDFLNKESYAVNGSEVRVARIDTCEFNFNNMADDGVLRSGENTVSKVRAKASGRVVDTW